MQTDYDALCARLRERHRVYPAQGSGSISASGKVVIKTWDYRMKLANRDGPEAADAITTLREELREARESADRLERNRDMWKGQCERQAELLRARDGK